MEEKKYRFLKERHRHELLVNGNWKSLTGITTILGVLAKKNLIPWASKEAVKKLGFFDKFIYNEQGKRILVSQQIETDGWTRLIETLDKIKSLNEQEYYNLLIEAKNAHTKRKEKAGDYGTKLHEKIGLLISKAMVLDGGYVKEKKVKDKSMQNFINWAVKNKVKFLESEKNLWSESLWLGGICDFICEINEQVWLGDIKTSASGLYVENFWQCAGYEIMLDECFDYKKVDGYVLLNLKENGEFLEKRSVSNEEHKKAFRACLEIYRQKEKTKNNILLTK